MRNSPSEFIPHSEYVQVLRPLLPAVAFAPSPRKLWQIVIHLAIVCSGYALIRFSNKFLFWLVCIMIIGHSLGCLAFLAHELSHNAIIRNRRFKRVLELLLWGLNVFPPTLWNRIHNQTHHLHTNTIRDTDRVFLLRENSPSVHWFLRVFVPNRKTIRWLPTVLFNFVPYIARYTTTAFYPGNSKPKLATAKPALFAGDKLHITGELLFIFLLQAGIYFAVGGRWLAYFFAGPLAYLVASAVVMSYIWTNHMLNPLCESNDPLLASTSVSVPPVLDLIHSNFSFHTEHHIFPSLNSDYYPLVSKLLKEHFKDRYNHLPITEAWRRLWQQEEFMDSKPTASNPSKHGDKS